MNPTADEGLVRRLPLPLAQLYRRAYNAKTPLERHQAAYYIWEAALKLLSAVVVVDYSHLGRDDPAEASRLRNLVRPSLGHWWEFIKRLVPILVEAGPAGDRFRAVRDWVLGPERDDLPRATGLDAALREVLESKPGARSTVRLSELFDRLVRYRNKEFGHGAQGQRSTEFYDRMGRSILAGVGEILACVDLLAGYKLVYIADVRRQASGEWLIERYELVGESARRIESLELPRSETVKLPDPERVHVDSPGFSRSLHPLVLFDNESGEFLFLNSRHSKGGAEYLCYSTGLVVDRADLGGAHREFLTSVVGQEVDAATAEAWTAHSREEEATVAAREPPKSGRRIGDFELLSRIGRGGMGVVYRAWQPSLGRQVALKCLLALGDPKTEARFAREIRSLGRVEHPNLLKVFTSGSDGDQWYYAMELIEGADLSSISDKLAGTSASEVGEDDWRRAVSTAYDEARKREEPIRADVPGPTGLTRQGVDGVASILGTAASDRGDAGYIARIVEIIRQAAEAAHALHEAGVIHRDIKPGNIMLTADGSHAVLMDLGLAQLADDAQGRLTRTRQFVGTLRYASPEQLLAAGRLDRRSDVYSLGASLWELLTLRPLFGAGEGISTPDLMLRIQSAQPGRPRHLNPRIPGDLEEIVLKCLEKDRERRYATAHDLAEDLGRWQRGEAVLAGPPSLPYIFGKLIRRHKAHIAVGAALALLLVVGVVAYFVRIQHARHVAEEARRALELMVSDVCVTQGLRSAEDGKPAQAVLWFAGAAGWARDDPAREEANRTRVRTWSRLAHVPVRAIPLLGQDIRKLTFHPSGRYLLVVGSEGSCRIWDLKEEREVTLPGSSPSASFAAWNPDGDRIAVGFGNGTVETLGFPDAAPGDRFEVPGCVAHLAFSPSGRHLAVAADQAWVWDCLAHRLAGPALPHPRPVLRVNFGSRSELLATICEDGMARVFQVSSIAADPRPLFDPVPNVVITPIFLDDDRMLLTMTSDRQVAWRDAATGKEVRPPLVDQHDIRTVVPSPDGKYFILCGAFRAQVFEVSSGRQVGPDLRHELWARSAAFSPNGGFVVTVSDDRTARIWTVPEGRKVGPSLEHQDAVQDVAYSPSSRFFATFQDDGLIRIWRVALSSDRELGILVDHDDNLFALSADGCTLLPGAWFANRGLRETRAYDVATGRPVGPVLQVGGLLNGGALSPDGRQAATISSLPSATACGRSEMRLDREPGWIQLWDVKTGQRLFEPLETPAEPIGAAYSPDGRTLVAICGGGQILTIDPAEWKVRMTLNHEGGPVEPGSPVSDWVRFSPDGRLFVTWGLGNRARVWEAATGAPLDLRPEHASLCCEASFSADGRLLLTASQDKTVRVWDLDRGLPATGPLRHPDRVAFARFSPDGRQVATACRDHTAWLWDWRAGQLAGLPLEHKDELFAVDFSRDGRWVLTASRDGTVLAWDRSSGKPVAPPWQFSGHPYRFQVTPDGSRAVAGGFSDSLRILDLRDLERGGRQRGDVERAFWPEPDPEGDRVLAEILSGRSLLPGGGTVNLGSEEWVDRWEEFSRRRPSIDLFRYGMDRAAHLLRQALNLRAKGNAAEAEARIREAIAEDPEIGANRFFWEMWFAISVGELKRGGRDLLDRLPAPAGGGGESIGRDYRWALEELAGRGALRINCGGKEYRSARGVVWGRDRFAVSGFDYNSGQGFPIAGTEDGELYRTERYFMLTGLEIGYRIPLLPGRYRVTLHFVESYHKSPGQRFFDVLLEGKEVLRNYEPGAAGYATADRRAFEVEVADGFLEIEFVSRVKDPKICAIEIRLAE